jgi:hypothetical protein
MDQVLNISLFSLVVKMTVHNIQNQCVIVKHIRYTSLKTCCTKSLPHHTSQIGTTIINALTMVIRIEPTVVINFREVDES